MDPFVIAAGGMAVFLVLALATGYWQTRRSSAMIRAWAEENSFTVLEKKQPLINLGPYRWDNPHGRTYYYLMVRDAQGRTRGGWVRCGTAYLGLFSRRIEVRWDVSEPPQAAPWNDQAGVWPPPPTR